MSEQIPQSPAAPYGAPPKPASAADDLNEPRRMSPLARLVNVFFSPGEVFEDVRRWPRDWYLPMIVLAVIATGAGYLVQQRFDLTPEALGRAVTDMGLEQQGKTRKDFTSPEEKQALETQEWFTTEFVRYAPLAFAVFLPLSLGLLAGIYRLILLVMQAKTTYFRILSVLAYSYYVPIVVKSLLNIVLAFIKQPEDVEPITYIRNSGLITASPAAFISATESPVLHAFLSFFDVFSIWWLVLATIGLVAVSRKLKLGTAAIVVAAPYVTWMVIQTLIAMVSAK
jgi:hypothetical protein